MTVHVERHAEAVVITIDRQEHLNALSFAMLRELGRAIDVVAEMNARAVVFIGAGTKAFCAGADVAELRGRGLMEEKRGAEFGQAAFARLDALEIPSIAMINGYAFGGGLELALACTFRLAVPAARMALPEIRLGLIPGYGGTQRLPRLVGEGRALDMILTGRSLDAGEAMSWGLVNRVVEGDPLSAALAFAGEITGYSLPVLSFARAAVRRAGQLALSEGLKVEAELSTLAYRTDDAQEGIAAFLEKRKPVFRDE
ncbi:MAG: enoyl-CoA hydratase [Alphaproteobacteria bacterium]|nr:enoyl-CoA hydratase [Alphaproteobacteria bacterium]